MATTPVTLKELKTLVKDSASGIKIPAQKEGFKEFQRRK
jgi:hypothetical protein